MCGIVGLFLKDPALRPRLGAMVSPMLIGMGDRGRDSAGLAVYRDPAPPASFLLGDLLLSHLTCNYLL